VIDGAQQIKVDLQRPGTVTARLVGSDPPSDLAVLKIDEVGLSPLALADSDKAQVGDIVLTIVHDATALVSNCHIAMAWEVTPTAS
jgi:hypothetical protein